MPTTTNFGWTTPADTDLVKDGAAAIRTLGNGIDTSLLDLKGGTTGQILSKNSNTDLDYTWITPNVGDITEVQAGTGISVASGTGPIPVVTNTVATTFDAKGDLVVGTGADTFAKLAVGTNDYVLTAASGEATGMKWAAIAAGGKNFSIVNSGGTALTGATTVTVTGISDADEILVVVEGASAANATAQISLQLNSDTGSNYYGVGGSVRYRDPLNVIFVSTVTEYSGYPGTNILLGQMNDLTSGTVEGALRISGCNSAGVKVFTVTGGAKHATSQINQTNFTSQGYYSGSSTISSVTVRSNSGNLDAGTVYVYKSA